MRGLVFPAVLLSLLLGCATSQSRRESPPLTWADTKRALDTFTKQTTYDDVIARLGKPYREFPTPSLPEEYVLYFAVPGEQKYMHWVMLDTQTKRFRYAGKEKQVRTKE